MIDYSVVILAGMAGLVEDLMGFAGGEAFVPEMEGQAGEGGEFSGEGLGFGGLTALVAGEMDGIADDDGCNGEAPAETGQRAQVFAVVVTALDGEHGLRREAELIGDGDADAAVADVEAEITMLGTGFQFLAPSYQLKARR